MSPLFFLELIQVDGENLDQNGCLVGPSGERVCPLGAFGADGQSRVQHRGNQGPGQTGSNGNAGPVNSAGLPIDPAAETYKKQVRRYLNFKLQLSYNRGEHRNRNLSHRGGGGGRGNRMDFTFPETLYSVHCSVYLYAHDSKFCLH